MSKLWGGRFNKKTHKLVEEFTHSISFDQKLAKYDCIGSLCHIEILKKANILTADEHEDLKEGIKDVLKAIQDGSFFTNTHMPFEDIHSFIQDRLEKKIGKVALKLHTSRSRNDQVLFDCKLYCLYSIRETRKRLVKFQETLQELAKKNKSLVIPGYTHLQHAMPVTLPHYLGAYVEMFKRDSSRLANVLDNMHLTLGAGALAGTSIEAANYDMIIKSQAAEIEFQLTSADNPLDTVSDRDFVIEILSGLSITAMHLSRLAEDMILWASKEFDFIDIDDAFCTGSSLMPQKKNPDVLELVRGNTGRFYGNLISILTTMKGLPLSYNRDLQADKEPLFDSFELMNLQLRVLTELFRHIKFKKENIQRQLKDESLYATDIADYLVHKGVAFKEAHTIIGKLMSHKYKKNKDIVKMTAKTLKSFHPSLTPKAVKTLINPRKSISSKKSIRRK